MIPKDSKIDVTIHYSPPREISPDGVWVAWLNYDGLTRFYSDETIPQLFEQISKCIELDFSEMRGIVG